MRTPGTPRPRPCPPRGCRSQADLWLEACVYACARLLSMAMHAYARLHPNTPHACLRLGSGTQRWTSCIVMHRFSAEMKKWCWWNFCLRALCAENVVMYCTILLQYFYHSEQIGTTFATKTNIRGNVCTLRLLPLSPKEEVRTGSTPTPIHSQLVRKCIFVYCRPWRCI